MQVEEGLFGEMVMVNLLENKEAETHPTQVEGGNPAGLMEQLGGIAIGRTDGRSRWDAGA